MACEYFIGDKKYSEQEFKQFLAEGGLDEFIASGDVNLTKLTISPIGVKPEPLAQVPAPTIAQQRENFGVSPDMVAPVEALLGKMYENQKQAGLTEATTIEEWLSIGQGEEKSFSLKIEGKDVEVKSVLPEVVNGFYSNTEKALSQVKQEKMSGNQWATQLLSRGANKEEMKWVGLEGFLKENAAKSISKADIQQYLKDNRIEVVEVVKGGDAKTSKSKARKVFEDKGYDVITDRNGDTYVEKDEELFDYNDMSELEQNAFDILTSDNSYRVNTLKDTTKFSKYQLEGEKENSKEILIVLPRKGQMVKVGDYAIPLAHSYGEDLEDRRRIVHLRINTRTDSEGNKVLFIEEIQSDWGQEGKEKGFKKGLTSIKYKKEDFYAKRVENNPSFIDVISKRTNTRFESYHVSDVKNEDGALNFFIKQKEGLEYQENASERTAIEPAPFVTDTNSWVKLGLKVALKEAVRQGADKIAWTTGEQQNERYSLSNTLESVTVTNEKKGERLVYVKAKNNSDATYRVDDKGIIIESSKNNLTGNVDGKRLEDVVGKDLTDKVMSKSEAISNFQEATKPQSIREHADNIFGTKMASSMPLEVMDGGVLAASNHNQIRESIISFLPVDMVNILRSKQFAPNDLFNNKDVVFSQLSVDERLAVGKWIVGAIRKTGALLRAELGDFSKTGRERFLLPTLKTSDLNAREIAGIVSGSGIFHLDSSTLPKEGASATSIAESFSKRLGVASKNELSAAALANLLNIHSNLIDVGKDNSLRLKYQTSDENIIQGDDFKVTSKGMKGFYGSPTEGSLGIVGNVAKSLSKQDVGSIKIKTKAPASEKFVAMDVYGGAPFEFETKKQAVDYVEKRLKDNKFEYEKRGDEYWEVGQTDEPIFKIYEGKEGDDISSTQNSIDITPELKKQAEEGQPLFKDSQAQFRIEAGKNTIEAIEKFDGSPKAVVALTHEVMHPTIVEIIDGAKNGNEVGLKHANTIVSEYNKANPSKKITLEQLIEDNDKFKEGKTTDAYRDAQEFMADSWETYFKEGAKGFSKAFQEVLDQITAAFRAVYNAISGKQLTPELRAMFDEILGKKPAQKPTLPELKENVKQAKQEVTRVQNALSKARTNLEKAGAEFQIDIYGNAKQNEMMFTPDIKSLNQKVEDAQTELAQAKRQQVKAEDALNAYVPENQLQIKDDNRNAEFGIEPNQPKLPTKDADLPRAIQPTERGAGSELDNEDDGGIGEERVQRLSDLPSNQSLSTDSGKRSPDSFSRGESGVEPGDNTSAGSSQSGLFGSSGVSPKSEPRAGDAKFNSADGSQGQFEDKLAAQKAVNNTPPSEVKLGDIKNIAKTLPYLFDGQIEDIWKAENRLMVDGKKGILFGNQTGTGKTFVFIGTMKRLKLANPNANILVITPKGPLKQTVNAAKVFDLDIKEAKSIKDSEGDMVITTYQNWYQNKGLKSRNWDLVIFDESQNLMENQKGVEKAYVEALRETVATPDESFLKAAQQIVGEKPAFDMVDNSLLKAWEENVEKNKSAIQKRADKLVADTKVILASATPFTHEFSLAYADGIILQIRQGIKAESSGAYNSMDARDMFYISNFGYRMRYNKLTEPDAKVDKDLMLQVFADKMMASGAMSTRLMNVDFDYSREFVLVESKIGEDIDEGISILQEEYKFPVSDAFGYQYLAPLLEAMKAKEMIPRIQAHLNMGRKVVVFHGYNNPIPTHPFGERLKEFAKTEAQYAALLKFWRDHPEYKNLNVGLQNPIETFKQAFGNEAMFYNGEVAPKIKEANKDEFNTADGRSLLIVNMAAGGAGLSLHDTVGDKQRVMLNLGLPVRPVFAIQTEGRIYRAGQASNAIFEYPIVNLGFERIIFGTKIAERVNATELLVLGSRARNLREVFRGGYIDATFSEPNEGQGVGGKENDVKVSDISQWDLAKSMYFGQKKGRQNDLGKDYFATPEPIGLKMVQFADLHEGDKMLEPSAGLGAIERFDPD
jgi:hypothetical protein